MKKNKKMIVISVLLIAITLLGVGTVAYFRRTVTGSLKGPTGNLTLVVNNADSVLNETFSVTLQRSEEEPYIYPDDKGKFDIDVDVTGSTGDVLVTFDVERINLPINLKFYFDEDYTEELDNYGTVVKKSDDMTMTLPIYWYWDGSVSDSDDNRFINTEISANIKVSAAIAKSLHSHLMSQEYTLDTDVDFSLESSETNGQGLMMMNSTQNDEYPIVYYRGDVANNNVIYNNLCWLIVRTTEKGGVKLIYNGLVNSDGSCNNYSGVNESEPIDYIIDDGIIGISGAFNTNYNSPVYAGYMYNDTNTYFNNNGTEYNSSDDIFDASGYLMHLANNEIDNETGRHVQNLKDSTIKKSIDAWFALNIAGTASEDLLEDTTWCNDRSVISETYTIENYATNSSFNFAAGTRLRENTTVTPSLVCSRDMDKFTVEEGNGNGDLTYPIGLLTADEVTLSGIPRFHSYSGNKFYLSIDKLFWTMTPSYFSRSGAIIFTVGEVPESLLDELTSLDYIIRPSISLNSNAYIVVGAGDGSFERPYLVNMIEIEVRTDEK